MDLEGISLLQNIVLELAEVSVASALINVSFLNFLQVYLLCLSSANHLCESFHFRVCFQRTQSNSNKSSAHLTPYFSSSWKERLEACESFKYIYKQHINMLENLDPRIVSFKSYLFFYHHTCDPNVYPSFFPSLFLPSFDHFFLLSIFFLFSPFPVFFLS